MRATAQARTLAMALDFVSSAIVKKNVPILTCTKIEAGDGHLAVTGCDLDVLLSAEIEAGIDAPFPAVCVPHARVAGLIAALPADAEVTIERYPEFDDDRLTIKRGRGRWRLPVRDPADFPVIAAIAPGAATFRLPGAEARRLIKRTGHAISDEKTRFGMGGLHITRRDNKLVFVATDGKRLCEAQSAIVDPGLIASVILPTATVALLDEVAATGDVKVRLTDRLVEFTGNGLLVRSRLIDGTFPDYARVIPSPSNNTVVAEAAAVLAAVERLMAVAGTKDITSIGIEWTADGLSLCLSREPDAGREEIEPETIQGQARAAVQAGFLNQHIEALDGKHVRLDHADRGSALRIDRPDEPMTVSVIMPMRWEAAAQERRVA